MFTIMFTLILAEWQARHNLQLYMYLDPQSDHRRWLYTDPYGLCQWRSTFWKLCTLMRFSQLDNFSIQRLFFWFKEMKKKRQNTNNSLFPRGGMRIDLKRVMNRMFADSWMKSKNVWTVEWAYNLFCEPSAIQRHSFYPIPIWTVGSVDWKRNTYFQ